VREQLVATSILLASACASQQPRGTASASASENSAAGAATRERAAGGATFDQTFESQRITFHVTCSNASSINDVTIVPAGLEIDNSPITREVEGSVVGAEVADFDANGSPEIYV
jgi:hypothetical protein